MLLEVLRRWVRSCTLTGRELDRYYVPSRYPDAFSSGHPGAYYGRLVAGRALGGKLVDWVGKRLKLLSVNV
jgi:HEPN domain-containing protein